MKGKSMARLDCGASRIELEDGTQVPFDKLLISSGAYYLLPPVPGLKRAGNVSGFRDLSDAQAIDRVIERSAAQRGSG